MSRRRRRGQDPNYFTQAGPVTVTRPDGTIIEQPAYGRRKLQVIVKVRGNISAKDRAYVMRRDRGCRYCGDVVGPFHIDHVVPIALGGSNGVRNYVMSCGRCNLRKGAQVWTPRPLSAMRRAD